MEVRISFDTNNAAFGDGNWAAEVRRVLEVAMDDVTALDEQNLYDEPVTLRDINGNRIGESEVRL